MSDRERGCLDSDEIDVLLWQLLDLSRADMRAAMKHIAECPRCWGLVELSPGPQPAQSALLQKAQEVAFEEFLRHSPSSVELLWHGQVLTIENIRREYQSQSERGKSIFASFAKSLEEDRSIGKLNGS